MTTNIAKLKRSKGTPPTAATASDVTAGRNRDTPPPDRALQIRVPPDVFQGFSEAAAREFGYVHGAKKQFFLKMWNAYKAQNM